MTAVAPFRRTVQLPAEQALDGDLHRLAALRAAGIDTVEVVEPLRCRPDDRRTVDTLLFLREVEQAGLLVRWHTDDAGLADQAGDYAHLQAPANDSDWANAWRGRYQRGSFYYRRGPGFCTVVRWYGSRQRITIVDEPAELLAFEQLLDSPIPAHRAASDPALAELLRAQVAHELAGVLMATPVRMTQWPIPVWSR